MPLMRQLSNPSEDTVAVEEGGGQRSQAWSARKPQTG
jgi:hypothetical protein